MWACFYPGTFSAFLPLLISLATIVSTLGLSNEDMWTYYPSYFNRSTTHHHLTKSQFCGVSLFLLVIDDCCLHRLLRYLFYPLHVADFLTWQAGCIGKCRKQLTPKFSKLDTNNLVSSSCKNRKWLTTLALVDSDYNCAWIADLSVPLAILDRYWSSTWQL